MDTQIPSLQHSEQFKDILTDYKISSDTQAILKDLKLVLMLAPTSTGRNTIIRELVKTGEYKYIVSDTTRPPRINDGVLEQNGVEYWFRDEVEMLADLKSGKFLEAEVLHEQQVSGISMRELQKAHEDKKIAITDVDIKGVENVTRLKPDTVIIMVLPPDFEEWQRRLEHRGQMSKEELRRRMQTAYKIFLAGQKYDYFYFVINKNLQDAAIEINELAHGIAEHPERQKEGKALIEKLCAQTKEFLDKTGS